MDRQTGPDRIGPVPLGRRRRWRRGVAHWLSSRGPVSVSMLLLSVSDASVCSVDMEEMSLAEDDWEAEPETPSGREDGRTGGQEDGEDRQEDRRQEDGEDGEDRRTGGW